LDGEDNEESEKRMPY